MKMKLNWMLIVTSVVLSSGAVFADESPAVTPSETASSPWGARGSLSFGFGSFGDSLGSIKGRTVDTLGIEVMPGYRWNDFFFGALAKVDFIGQTTDPATVGNQNLKGRTMLFGVGAAYRYLDYDFQLGVSFLGSHSLAIVDTVGRDVCYKKPFGIELQAGYYFKPNISAGLKYEQVSFAQDTLSGAVSDVSTNKRKHTNFAAVVTYHY